MSTRKERVDGRIYLLASGIFNELSVCEFRQTTNKKKSGKMMKHTEEHAVFSLSFVTADYGNRNWNIPIFRVPECLLLDDPCQERRGSSSWRFARIRHPSAEKISFEKLKVAFGRPKSFDGNSRKSFNMCVLFINITDTLPKHVKLVILKKPKLGLRHIANKILDFAESEEIYLNLLNGIMDEFPFSISPFVRSPSRVSCIWLGKGIMYTCIL